MACARQRRLSLGGFFFFFLKKRPWIHIKIRLCMSYFDFTAWLINQLQALITRKRGLPLAIINIKSSVFLSYLGSEHHSQILRERHVEWPWVQCLRRHWVQIQPHPNHWGLLLFSRSVMSDSLPPHRLQHARLPCLHYFPEFAQVISIELVMLSNHLILCCPFSCLQSFPASGSFLLPFASGAQELELQLHHQSFQ